MQFHYDAAHTGDYSLVAGCPPSNSTLRWRSPNLGGGFVTAPTVGNGVICVPSNDGYIYTLNLATGQPAWPQPFQAGGQIRSSPAIKDSTIYVGSYDGYLYALDAATGRQKWSQLLTADGVVDSSPAVVGGVVYVWSNISNKGRLFALDAKNGSVLWRYPTCLVANGNSVAVANGVAYVGCYDNRSVYAIDVATRRPRWGQPFKTDAGVTSSPSVAYGAVYVEDLNSVYAIDAATGEAKWPEPFTTGGPEGGIPAALTVANGMVFAASKDHNVYAINATTGQAAWPQPFTADSSVMAAPAYANGILYIGSETGNVYAINATTGQAAWPQPFMIQNNNMALQSSPVVFNGVVYVGSGDGYVYAIGTQPIHKLTLVASPTVHANQSSLLTGRLTSGGTGVAGKSVTLQIAAYLQQPKEWRSVASAITDAVGAYVFKRVARFEPYFSSPCFRTIYKGGVPPCTVVSNVVKVNFV
ncbi:MAG: PQQ-binding-like beta-propeller repeat protein [Euryarchaeota archaeon]|nr:PQQ-binding-like beta-propeller repeat protein [Euryarchaeota archaeon]